MREVTVPLPLCPKSPWPRIWASRAYEPVLYWLPQTRSRGGSAPRPASPPAVPPPPVVVPADCPRNWISASGSRLTAKKSRSITLPIISTPSAPAPVQVSVVVSNTCNLHCTMCPYHSREIRPTHKTPFFAERRSMSWELLERIAGECGGLRVPVKMGNVEEPLVHPGIVEFVRRCRTLGVPAVHITTNGTLLTLERGKELLEAGLTSLYVSLDAARPETYRQVRHADLARVEENVRAFLETRRRGQFPCRVLLSFVRNRGVTPEEEEEFVGRWLPQSDGVILYQLAEYEGGNSRFAAVHEVAEAKMREAGGRWPCLNPWQEMYLLPDGATYYCCETISKLAFEPLESMGPFSRAGNRGDLAGRRIPRAPRRPDPQSAPAVARLRALRHLDGPRQPRIRGRRPESDAKHDYRNHRARRRMSDER